MRRSAVSVVIPAFRASRTIARAVTSVLAQTESPIEIVVVDDGSPDDLAAALEPFGDRVTLARKPNGGAASARNLGIERSSGDLIAFLDADDYWEPEKLEHQVAVLEAHPGLGLVASRYFSQAPGDRREPGLDLASGEADCCLAVEGAEAMAIAAKVWTSTVVVRREALGGHRFVSGLEPAEDRDLWVRIIAAHPVYLSSRPLATMVLEPGSLSRSSVDVDCGNMMRVLRRHADLLGARGLRTWEARTFRRWAGNHLAQGRPREAVAPAWSRLRLEPLSPQAWWILLKAATLAGASRPIRPLPPDGNPL